MGLFTATVTQRWGLHKKDENERLDVIELAGTLDSVTMKVSDGSGEL